MFDLAVAVVVALSALMAFARGIVRSLIALCAGIAGLIAGIAWTPRLAAALPIGAEYPVVPYVVAFALIFVGALLLGAALAWPLRAAIHRAGLGFADRSLGALFGIARGLVVVVAFVLAAGLTPMPAADWWQNSLLAGPLTHAALALRPWLPPAWAERLEYPERNPRTGA